MRARRSGGFSLVELLVAVTLGLLSIAAVGTVFATTSASFREGEHRQRLQDSLRFAMTQLAQDVEMAGFFAQLRDPAGQVTRDASIAAGYTMTSCGGDWVFGDLASLQARGNATAAMAHAAFPCISPGEFLAGTDVMAIRRLRGRCVDPRADGNGDGREDGDGRYYLRTNGTRSVLYRHQDGVAPPPPGGTVCAAFPTEATVDVYEYMPVIWYVRRFPVLHGAPVPSLCRKTLKGGGMEAECVVEGIEDLQVELGLDRDGDGTADGFTSFDAVLPPALAERIVAVRVHLLARSARRDFRYTNAITYRVGDRQHSAPGDGYYRRTLSSVVLLRNVAQRVLPHALAG